jgi:hypothetical protein
MNQVWRFSHSTGRARLVLLAIADHQGELGAWPSIATLARMTNASERSIKRDIQELVELGELRVEYQAAPTSTQYKTNRYWVTVAGVTDQPSGVTELTSGVTDGAIRGDTVGTQNLKRTLKEPLDRTRATRLPEDWHPDETLLEMFSTKWPGLVPNRDYHIENFKLYWLASGKPMKSWALTFQKWMNTEQLRISKRKPEVDWDELERWAKEQDEREGRS